MIRFDVRDPLIRAKLSAALKGNKRRLGKPAWNKGMKMPEAFRQKMREVATLNAKRGELHWNWKGGVKSATKEENKRLRKRTRRLKTRFLALVRDKFTCQYCGRKPPAVTLEVDHRFPKSKGGGDDLNNYITACSDCNLGKRDIILTEFITQQ